MKDSLFTAIVLTIIVFLVAGFAVYFYLKRNAPQPVAVTPDYEIEVQNFPTSEDFWKGLENAKGKG